MSEKTKDRFLKIADVARIWQVSPQTARAWARSEPPLFEIIRLPKGRIRIRESVALAFITPTKQG